MTKMKLCSLCHLGLILVASWQLGASSTLSAQTPKSSDSLDCVAVADAKSGTSHQMTTSGKVVRETLNVEIGTLREKYPVATLSGRGAELSVTMHVARPKGSGTLPILLEVQVIHNRRPQTF